MKPPPFRWGLFAMGVGVTLVALARGMSRLGAADSYLA
jgi:hypothetical protein